MRYGLHPSGRVQWYRLRTGVTLQRQNIVHATDPSPSIPKESAFYLFATFDKPRLPLTPALSQVIFHCLLYSTAWSPRL
jgi:hypothetical protein